MCKIFTLICILLFVDSVWAQNEPVVAPSTKDEPAQLNPADVTEYRNVLDRFQIISQHANFEELKALVEEVQKNWSTKPPALYGRLMLRAVEELHQAVYQHDEQRESLKIQTALLALKGRDSLPMEVEVGLVEQLDEEVHGGMLHSEKARAELRAQVAPLWGHAWKRVADAIDLTWNPQKDIPKAIDIPPGAKGGGGGHVEFSDPVAQQTYDAKLEDNRRKAAIAVQQMDARQIQHGFAPRFEKAIIGAYLQPPPSDDELKSLLDTYVKDPAVRDRILSEIKADRTNRTP